MDQGAMVDMLLALLDGELITREDAVRTLQGMGVIPDGIDAAAYVEQIQAEHKSAADEAEARVVRMRGGDRPARPPAQPIEDDDDAQATDPQP